MNLVPLTGFSGLDDDIDRTVDYGAVCEDVKVFVAQTSDRLLETLAERIALHLLEVFPLARVRVELRKFVLPETNYVAVAVTRERTR
jgi:dihydroneopterin aldolase